MIGGARDADAEAEVDFPLGRKIQVDSGENLVLLLKRGEEVRGWADGTVILDPARNLFVEVVADFHIG